MSPERAGDVEYEVIASWRNRDARTGMELRHYPDRWEMCCLRQTYAGSWYVTNAMTCPTEATADA